MFGSKKWWVQRNLEFKLKKFGIKKFWVHRNLQFKEIQVQIIWLKTELLFKKSTLRFQIQTNCGKILGPERFGSKEVGSQKILIKKI